jgi:hypothetical protein
MFLRTLPLRRFTIRTPTKRPRLLPFRCNFRHVKSYFPECGQKERGGGPKRCYIFGVARACNQFPRNWIYGLIPKSVHYQNNVKNVSKSGTSGTHFYSPVDRGEGKKTNGSLNLFRVLFENLVWASPQGWALLLKACAGGRGRSCARKLYRMGTWLLSHPNMGWIPHRLRCKNGIKVLLNCTKMIYNFTCVINHSRSGLRKRCIHVFSFTTKNVAKHATWTLGPPLPVVHTYYNWFSGKEPNFRTDQVPFTNKTPGKRFS